MFSIILNRTIPNPQHRRVLKLARTPINEEPDFLVWSNTLFVTNQTPRIIAIVPRINGKVIASPRKRCLVGQLGLSRNMLWELSLLLQFFVIQ